MLWNSTFGHLFVRAGLSKPELGGSEQGKIGQTLLRILLGVVLLLAAGMKVHELSTTPYIAAFPPRWMMIVFTELEILFALWLLFVPKNFEKITWLATVGLFSFFALVTLYKALSGEASCGCFGRVEINPWYTLVFDSMVTCLLLRFRPKSKHFVSREIWLTTYLLRSKNGIASLLGVSVLWLMFCIPSTWSMASFIKINTDNDLSSLGQVFEGPRGKPIVMLEPQKWVGKEFSLFNYIDIGQHFKKASGLSFFFHHDCPDCQKVISSYANLGAKYFNEDELVHVALVEIPPFTTNLNVNCTKGFSCTRSRLNNSWEWFVETPLEIQISQGIITSVTEHNEVLSKWQ